MNWKMFAIYRGYQPEENLAEEFPAGWQVTCGWQYGWQVTFHESLIVRHTTTDGRETFDD